jgi:glutaredoxin-like protein NrdH
MIEDKTNKRLLQSPALVVVEGEHKGDIFMYTLSTCIWCKKTKALLSELGIAYSYIDVDLVDGQEKKDVITGFTKLNPETSFPTIVLDGEDLILGFQEDEIREYVEGK